MKSAEEAYLELKPKARTSLDGWMSRNGFVSLSQVGEQRPDLASFLIEFDQDLWPIFLDDPPFCVVEGDTFKLTPTAHEVLRGEFEDERLEDPRVLPLLQDWLRAAGQD